VDKEKKKEKSLFILGEKMQSAEMEYTFADRSKTNLCLENPIERGFVTKLSL
jgi:hypothetical protein